MAIFKISGYISKYAPMPVKVEKARKYLNYIITRVNSRGEKQERQLFNYDGDVDKDFALSLIDNSRGKNIFKIILNFDGEKEDTYKDLFLKRITNLVILELQEIIGKDFEYVAVLHTDHTSLRHVHLMAFVNGKIMKEHLLQLRTVATREALLQRRQRDLALTHSTERSIDRLSTSYRPVSVSEDRARASPGILRDNPPPLPCPDCGNGYMKKVGQDLYRCVLCGRKQERGLSFGL